MTLHIKENARISHQTVTNCKPSDTMILTLIPFLLGARFESPDITSWQHGTEVTYLVQNHATTYHLDNSKSVNMDFHLRTMLTCKKFNSSLFCYFHDVSVDSSPVDIKQPRQHQHVLKDLWTEKILRQDVVEIAYRMDGRGELWFSMELEPVGRAMMVTLARLLIVGMDLSARHTGNFQTASDLRNRHCATDFFAMRFGPMVKHKSANLNLFLIPRPDESFARPLEISQKVVDPACNNKAHWYSFFVARELPEIDCGDMETQLDSAENFITIEDRNFTSFSKIRTTIRNYREKSKYIVDESISLSLQKISSPQYPHCNDDKPHFHEDFSNEKINIISR